MAESTGNMYLDTFGPAEAPAVGPAQSAPAAAAQAVPAPTKGEPAANSPVMQPAGPSTGNMYLDQYGPAEAPSAPSAPPAPPEPPSFASQAGVRVKAGAERMAGAAQDIYGAGMFDANRRIFWQATELPTAIAEAQRTGQPIANDPGVQMAAKHLGITPQEFAAGAQAYANMSPDRIKEVIEHAKKGMQDALGSRAAGGAKRREAGAMEQSFAPGFGEGHGFKNLSLDAAGIAPELAGAFGLSLLPGGAPVAMTALGADFGLRGWSHAKDAGADDQTAATYGILNAAASVAPEMPVLAVLNKSPAAMQALNAVAGKVISNPSFRQWAGATTLQSVAMGLQSAVTIGLDKGLLGQDISLKDALLDIGKGMLTGALIGAPMTATHMGINRMVNGPAAKPTAAAPPGDALSSVVDATNPAGPPRDVARSISAAQDIAENDDALGTVNQTAGLAHRPVIEAPHTVMDHAQRGAAAAAARAGGDSLDQTVAATHANAEVGAHHDAAAVGALRDRRAAAQEASRLQIENDSAMEAQNVPSNPAEEAFTKAEADRQAQKDQDFTAARNQVGDQLIDIGNLSTAGAERGGANEPLPTLADTMTPDQRQAFETLKELRAAAAAEPKPEPTVQERLREQAKGTEDDFQELPPVVPPNRLAAIRAAAQKRARPGLSKPGELARAAEDEDLLPEKGPPPVTTRTLADRRRAAMDQAMSDKVRTRQAALKEQAAQKPETISPESQQIAQKFQREAEFNRNADYSRLMNAKPGEHEPLTANMPIEEAQQHLDRLNAAPGTNDAVHAALENRIAAGRTDVDAAAHEAAASPKNDLPQPTEAQHRAGNFKMGHTEVAGLPVTVEYPAGSERPAANGETRTMAAHYGFVKGTVGADGMHVDTLVGKHPENDTAFVVDHLDEGGAFEQHKILLGFNNKLEAMRAYRRAFPDNPLGPVSEVKTSELKNWLANGDTTRPYDQRAVNRQAGTRSRFADSNTSARAEDQVYTRNPDGTHVVETPGDGRTTAIDHPNGHDLTIRSTETARGDRGAGNGSARLERLSQIAHDRGGRLVSDNRVSEPASRVYQRLAEKGYDVQTNPHEVDSATSERRSASELKGVYEVGPRDLSRLNGLRLKRLASQGDPTARVEMDRRLNASEPTGGPPEQTPEQGALATKRTLARDTAPGSDRTTPRVTKEQATQRLQPLIDKVGADKFHVHDGLNDPAVPQHVRDDAAAFNHPDPRAVYDPATGEFHFFAGAGGHGSVEDLHNTAVHELAHKGLRSFLGDDYSRVMQDVYANIHDRESALKSPIDGIDKTTAKNWISDYLAQHGLDPRNPRHQATAADEYSAHLAERDASDPNHENPGILRRVIDAVRAGLRKVGVVHEWTDNDIRRLLRESNNNTESEHARAATEYRGDGLRWADSDDGHAERFASDDPRAVAHKFGLTVEQQANHNPGWVKSRVDALKDTVDRYEGSGARNWDPEHQREATLATLPLRNIVDFADPRRMPAAREFIRAWDERTIRRNRLEQESNKKLDDWTNWARENPELDQKLQELMHRSTRAEADPSQPFEERYTAEARAKRGLRPTAERPEYAIADADRKVEHKSMQPLYEAIGPKGREIYQATRDHLRQRGDAYYAGIDRRAQVLGMEDNSRKNLMTLLNRKFERGRIAPYFPLSRFGPRWSVAKDADGNVASYTRFDKQKAQNEWEDAARAHGLTVDGGHNLELDREIVRRSDPQFIRDIEKATDGISDVGERDALRSEIYQKYLERLPDSSIRKHSMRRTGVPGFTGDMRRAFSDYAQKSANAIAQLEHNHMLDTKLADIKDQAQSIEGEARGTNSRQLSVEAQWARSLSDEFTKRRQWMDNPQNHWLANAITRNGFGWFLGWSPASALRILSQNSMIAAPRLASLHGALSGRRALWRANVDWAGHHIQNALGVATMQWARVHGPLSDSLRGEERQAMETAAARGLFSATQTNALTQHARGEADISPGPFRKYIMTPAAASAKFLFQAAELHNRETSMLAGYRLARRPVAEGGLGMSHTDATWHGMRISDESHFDYSNEGRARLLQSDAGKVLGQFQQYRIGVLYRLARDARDGLVRGPAIRGVWPGRNENITVEQRNQAAKMFSHMLVSGSMWFGAAGLPFAAQTISAVMNAVLGLQGNAKVDAHAWLKQHMGSFAADTIMTGLVGATLHAGLSNGASYSDLFYRPPDPNETPRAQMVEKLAGLAGPPGSVAVDAAQGYGLLRDGQVERALEHFMPMGLRGPLKAYRYAHEGVQAPNAVPNVDNAKVVAPNELSDYDLAIQSLGITPGIVDARYRENAAIQNVSKQIEVQKTAVKDHFMLGRLHNDPKEIGEAGKELEQFNKANPSEPITPDEIENYINAKIQKAGGMTHGVSLPPGRRYLNSTYRGDAGAPAPGPPQ